MSKRPKGQAVQGTQDTRENREYSPEEREAKFLAAVELIGEETAVGEACERVGINRTTLYRWRKANTEWDEVYRDATRILAQRQSEKAVRITKEAYELAQSSSTDPKKAMAIVQGARNYADRLSWHAARMDPETYGDKVSHTASISHHVVVELPALLPTTALPRAKSTPLIGNGETEVIEVLEAEPDGKVGD